MQLLSAMSVVHWAIAASAMTGDVSLPEKMFPDGFSHDFGKVAAGTQLKHAFRIVNAFNVPMHIVSVRRGA